MTEVIRLTDIDTIEDCVNKVVHCDCIDLIKKLPDNYLHAVITDPPYFLYDQWGKGFMGKSWDSIGDSKCISTELAPYVISFFRLFQVESNMVEENIVPRSVSTKHLDGREKKNSITSVPSVVNPSKDTRQGLKVNTSSVRGIVLTKVEVLDMFDELLKDHTNVRKALQNLNDNALFVIPCSLLNRLLENTVPENVLKLPIEKTCLGKKIHLTSTAEARIRGAIEALIGMMNASWHFSETAINVGFVMKPLQGEGYTYITSFHIVKHKITRWIISLLSVLAATPESEMGQSIYRKHHRWTSELLRVIKPGGYLLAFSSARTYHRLACAIEDSGFIIRDMIEWLYGVGFPKGQNLGKVLEKKFFGSWLKQHPKELGKLIEMKKRVKDSKRELMSRRVKDYTAILKMRWMTECEDEVEMVRANLGYRTALKPAHEPIAMAQKPREGTYLQNFLKYGTGYLDIDRCRIAVNASVDAIGRTAKRGGREEASVFDDDKCGFDNTANPFAGVLPSGRYPANLILSHDPRCRMIRPGEMRVVSKKREEKQNMGEHGIYGDQTRTPTEMAFDVIQSELWECAEGCPVSTIDGQSGVTTGCQPHRVKSADGLTYDGWGSITSRSGEMVGYEGKGGASRYFERFAGEWECVEGCPISMIDEQGGTTKSTVFDRASWQDIADGWKRPSHSSYVETTQGYDDSGGVSRYFYYCPKPSVKERNAGLDKRCTHVTVKPIRLMRYLIRLVTRADDIILDPFLGSGTTAISAENEGVNWIGCDQEQEYCEIAVKRIGALGGKSND